MKHRTRAWIAAVLMLLLAAPAAVGARRRVYEFRAFTVPPELGSLPSAHDINDSGMIVGNVTGGGFSTVGFVFDRGSFTEVIVPGSIFHQGTLRAINDHDEAVGLFVDADTLIGHGFHWNTRGEILELPDPATDATYTDPQGLNNQGVVVGYYIDAHGDEVGYIQSGGESTTYDFPGQSRTILTGINDGQQIVGVWIDGDENDHGFLLSRKGTSTPIAFPGAASTRPEDINRHGQIVGSYRGADHIRHGFLFEKGVYQTLDFPGAIDTIPTGINDQGVIVGKYNDFVASFVATPRK